MYIREKSGRLYVCGKVKDPLTNKFKEKTFSLNKQATAQNKKWATVNKEKLWSEKQTEKKKEEIAVEYSLSKFGDYALNVTRSDRDAKSEKATKGHLKGFVKFFGDKSILDIKSSEIREWQSYMIEKGNKPKTIQNHRSTLSLILNLAVDDEIITRNPISRVKLPKDANSDMPTVYSTEEIMRILKSCGDDKYRRIFQTLFFTGMRPGELIALKWSDIDFQKNTIYIQRRIKEGDIGLPKGKKKRFIYLFPQAKKALLEQKESNEASNSWVWLTYAGNYYSSTKTLNNAFQRACRNANVKESSMYHTRHSFATMMLQHQQTESWLIQQMGHYEFLTTIKHYVGKLKPNIEAINNIIIDDFGGNLAEKFI